VSRKGFTLTELLVALTIGGFILALALPAFMTTVRRSRLAAAARQVATDLREARSQAITSGWEYRLVGYDATSSTRRNQYRCLGRSSAAGAWPDIDSAPFRSTTQYASAWTDIGSAFPGVGLQSADAGFEVTFDARGAAPAADDDFNPLTVSGTIGSATVTVAMSGSIRIDE
jgi:prepilin-type N-terminal cleavage/methylation domain-containing protein